MNGNKKVKHIPSINRGDGETLISYIGRCDEYISKLEWQSEGHRMWYTHKNPYGCWICELLQVVRELRECVNMDETDNSTGLVCEICDNITCTCDP